jgi:hypothetical protein
MKDIQLKQVTELGGIQKNQGQSEKGGRWILDNSLPLNKEDPFRLSL